MPPRDRGNIFHQAWYKVVSLFLREIRARADSRLTSWSHITCERGRDKHCAKVDFAFLWKYLKLGYPRNGYPSTDQDETLHSWLSCFKELQCKNWLRSAGWGFLHEWVNYNGFGCCFSLFLSNSPTAQTGRPTYACYISKDVFEPGMCLFPNLKNFNTKTFMWGYTPKPPLLGAGIRISSLNVESNNIRMARPISVTCIITMQL
jgi:hypothetical protein